jgi:dCMP deaminase
MKSFTRITKDDYYLKVAEAILLRGTCLRRNFGAVIVKDDKIVGTGYTGSARGEKNCCDTGICIRQQQNIPQGQRYELCMSVHAEQNAVINAKSDLHGATLYLVGKDMETEEFVDAVPCLMCWRTMTNAGIVRVVNRKGEVPSGVHW